MAMKSYAQGTAISESPPKPKRFSKTAPIRTGRRCDSSTCIGGTAEFQGQVRSQTRFGDEASSKIEIRLPRRSSSWTKAGNKFELSNGRNARNKSCPIPECFGHSPFEPSIIVSSFEFRISNFRFGFTLIELLVVIVIITVLMGLAFPVYHGVQDQTKRIQARNDLVQIVVAVNAYYTEYGRYPRAPTTPSDTTYGGTTTNDQLFNELRSVNAIQNPRGLVFLSPPDVKDPNNPRAGIGSAPATDGQYFDPWGKPYLIRIDSDYDNQVTNPYSQNAGSAPLLRAGVIAWSFGKDGLSQSVASPIDKNVGANRDDIISWQ